MGCVLRQHDSLGRKERVVYYFSKKFTSYESKYSLLEKTCCALTWTTQRLRQYMLYYATWLISKMDPIKYIFEKSSLFGRIAKWQVLLLEYDIIYVTRKAMKGSAIVDCLANFPVEDYEPMKIEFPDEDVMIVSDTLQDTEIWTMFFDGATNEVGHGVGAILTSSDGKSYPLTTKLYFDCTHNMAEYEACSMGVQMAYDMKIKKLQVYRDSLLAIHQLNGEWETIDSKLIPYDKYIRELAQNFESITFKHVPCENNQIANALATLSTMFNVV
ncbi:uncharacterized protein E5676_scaffold49G00050 [Cucumis melo var. makuwa]|uniref:Uncharacterized protein n=1 Tax=Cucumis melo var. makuwa TaxID=1194695 RepID=A0A5D3BPI8_CUCMM|nr:uncharacterized protein E6C27_scaffold43059G00190 [Cucumis melo var. makuwa]TYK01227.1 uncharacterized protein E5676_scaffold49G00050 [Cucumis melo var. makuwa]